MSGTAALRRRGNDLFLHLDQHLNEWAATRLNAKVGDRIRARTINPVGHTRLPRYARGRDGQIARYYGVFVFPDTHAHGLGPAPQHLYSVRFTARELWGPTAPAGDAIYLDMWDDYVDPA